MDKKLNRQKLILALESGDYKQTTGALTVSHSDGNRFCCLGVACDLYQKEVGDLEVDDSNYIIKYDHSGSLLPSKVRLWLGFKDEGGLLKGTDAVSLASLNDKGASFNAIASLIKADLVALENEKAEGVRN
jgi:hypothetical protein